MFKNSVLNPSVDTIKWLKAAGIRALKTMAQTAIPMIPVGISVSEVDWKVVLGVCIGSGICSILTSITGIPEVEQEEE
jgi:hypothetical protein